MSTAPKQPPDGDVDIGYQLTTVVIVTFTLAATAVTMRMYTRARLVRQIEWDDWVILFAVLLGLIASITELIGVYAGGLGRHSFYLTAHQKSQASKYSIISQAFCIMSLCFAKVSICISLLGIIRGVQASWTRGALWGTVILQFVVNTAVMICLLIQCWPSQKIWNQHTRGSCWDPKVLVKLTQVQGAVSVFSDWSLSFIPYWIIHNLQLRQKHKIILCVLMGLGVITGVFAIVRTAYLVPYFDEKDTTFTSATLLIWAGLERNIACTVACVPSIRPLGQKFARLVSQASSRYRSTGANDSGRSDQHELSTLKQRNVTSKTATIPASYAGNELGGIRAESLGPSIRSNESILPLHSNEGVGKTTQIKAA